MIHEKIKEAIEKDNLILFVGAGMSIPFGFPNWTQLILNILERLKEEVKDDSPINFDYYINQQSNLDVFKSLKNLEQEGLAPRVKALLYDEIKKINIKDSDFTTQEKLWKISEKIITTNYDKVLEEKKPREVDSFSNNNQFQQFRSLEGASFLYKIHGDIVDTDNCILFESDYKRLYKEKSSDRETLRTFLQSRTILFLGFSFEDPFIQKQLDYLKQLYEGHNRDHFIVLNSKKDLKKYKINTITIDDWDVSFNQFLDELIYFKQQQKDEDYSGLKNKIDIDTVVDIIALESMLEEKKEELLNASDAEKKRISKELYSIGNRILELQTEKLQLNFKQYIPNHKENELEHIFESVFSSEKLTTKIIEQIHKVKDQHSGDYNWYHRSVLVSALACSLINHKKVDPNKVDLLIDFTNESEDKVWQKSVTYLFLVLNHLGNKWLRFSALKPKLELLKTHDKIQSALRVIIACVQMEFHNITPLSKSVFENDYFRNSPFNYFLPFFNNNPSLEKIYDDDSIDNVDEYINYLYEVPLPDAFKYLICNSDIDKTNNNVKLQKNEERFILYMLNIHNSYEPYLNYVNELLNFYQNFPELDMNLKQKTTIIGFRNMKIHLLSSLEHHRAMARQFELQNEWNKSIIHYEQLLNIDDKDIEAMQSLSIVYSNTQKNDDDSLKLCLKIEKHNPNNHDNLNIASMIFNRKNNYNKALDYINRAIIIDDSIAGYYANRGIINEKKEDYEGVILDYDKAIELEGDNIKWLLERGRAKHYLGRFEQAIEDFDKGIKLDNKNPILYSSRALSKHDSKKYEEAIIDFDKALSLEKRSEEIYNGKANSLRRLKRTEEAHKLTSKALSINNNNGFTYGNIAAIYSTEGNIEKFYEYLEKALEFKAKASWFDNDIKEKHKEEKRFKDLLFKYNQALDY